MQPSKLNKIKRAVCFLVIFSLVLQISFYPLAVNAASGGGLWAKLARIFSKITVPDKVGMDKEGAVKLGTLEIYQFRNANNEKVNPFNNIGEFLFGKQKENLLIKDGKLTIATPEVPEVCQLGLIKPIEKGGSGLEENEQLARRRACNYLIRLQTAAAQEAFVAKSIYTKTNPKGDCLFLQNCKSVCSLRFGEIKYVVTFFDIAEFLLPTGWMSVIYKIVNIVAMFGEIQTVLTAAKAILQDGISLVNSAISTFNYLVNLFESLQGLGGNLSASLGVAAVVAQGALGGIGGDLGTGIDIGTGVAAGVVTGITLAKSGAGMKEMLGRFADNMLAYGQAKTEASQTLLGIKGDIISVIEGGESIKGLKKEEKIAFLFKPQNETDQQKKDFLNKAVTEYRAFFENSTELLERISLPGDLLGQTVLEVTTGTTEDFNNLNEKPNFIKVSKPGEPVETIDGDRTFDKSFCSGRVSGGYSFDEAYKSSLALPGGGPELLRITEPEYIATILDQSLGTTLPDAANYNEKELNESRAAWYAYWESIGKIILGAQEVARINAMDSNDCRLRCKLGLIQYEILEKRAFDGRVIPFWFLTSIASLDRVYQDGRLYGAGIINSFSL